MVRKPRRAVLVLTVIAMLGAPVLMAPKAQASDPFIAEIKMFAGNFAPRDYYLCDGQILQISQNTALFSLLGTTYGGDGRTSYGLPDLRGRTAVHPGTGPGLSQVRLGQRSGSETTILTVSNMPSHVHQAILHATSTDGNEEGPQNHFLAGDPREDQYSNAPAPNVTMNMACITMTAQGSNQPFSVRDPYLGIHHIIAHTGIYPSRP